MRVKLKSVLIAATLCAGLAQAAAAGSVKLTESWRLNSELAKPESALYDPSKNVLYVSNINGGGKEKNGQGYIATVSPDGKVLNAKWVGGLNAPKGLGVMGGKLVVADIDEVVLIDIDTAKIASRHSAPSAKFLNDVAVNAAGTAFISDSKNGQVYALKDGKLTVWLEKGHVGRPNGLYAAADHLVIAAGDGLAKKPHKARYLHLAKYSDRSIRPWQGTAGMGRIDGVQPDAKGGFFLTEFKKGKLMHMGADGRVATLASPRQGNSGFLIRPEATDDFPARHGIE